MDETIHPFDFESCQLPTESVEKLLGIQQVEKVDANQNFFKERINFVCEMEEEVDLYSRSSKDENNSRVQRIWEEEQILNLVRRKTNSRIASVSFADVIRSPHYSTEVFSPDLDPNDNSSDTSVNERKVTDKWGFVVEEGDGTTNSMSRMDSRSQNKREEKWIDTLRDWGSYSEEKKRRITKKLIRKGIPDRMRGAMWKSVLDVEEIRLENRDLFQRLLDEESEFENQIQIDIHRTLPRHIYFQEQGGMGQTSLFNALKAYSVYDKTVGYCQGMGFIMAMFLLYMPEEDAFFTLAQLISKHEMAGYFEPGFPALIQCFYIHDQLLHSNLPRLAAHFDEQNIQSSMYTTQWYPTMFSIALPFEFTVRIWDLFMVDGIIILYRSAIAILRLIQKDLIKVDFEVIMDRLRNLSKYLTVTPDEFIAVMTETSNITAKRLAKHSKEFTTG